MRLKKISPGQCLCHFILLTVSFKEQSFSFLWSPIYPLFLLWIMLSLLCLRTLCLIVKSVGRFKNFIFRSMIYLVQSVMFGSRFIFLTTDVQLFQHHLLKRLSFLHQIAFAFLSKVRSICAHLFLVSLSLFHSSVYMSLWPAPHFLIIAAIYPKL